MTEPTYINKDEIRASLDDPLSENQIVDKLTQQLYSYIDMIINDELRIAVKKIINFDDFFKCPAAQTHHHNFPHGLLLHTLETVKMAWVYCTILVHINTDVVLASAIIHDVGKVKVYHYDKEKKLVITPKVMIHHIVEGIKLISAQLPETNPLYNQIIQCVKSHHNLKQWGALTNPQCQEDWLIHLADMSSANLLIRIQI